MKKRVLISFTFVVVIILILVFYIKIHNNKEADVKIKRRIIGIRMEYIILQQRKTGIIMLQMKTF